jgi:hypothetical protein
VLARLQEISSTRYVAPYNVALIYLGLGDKVPRSHGWSARSQRAPICWRFISIRTPDSAVCTEILVMMIFVAG